MIFLPFHLSPNRPNIAFPVLLPIHGLYFQTIIAYIHMYTYMYVSIFVHIYIFVHICTCIHIYIYMMYVCACIFIQIFSPKYNLLNLYNVSWVCGFRDNHWELDMVSFFPFHFAMLLVASSSAHSGALKLVRHKGCRFLINTDRKGWSRGQTVMMLVGRPGKDMKHRCRDREPSATQHQTLEGAGTGILPSVVKRQRPVVPVLVKLIVDLCLSEL